MPLKKKIQEKICEILVYDIFNFQDGRTLFSGELSEYVAVIGPCIAEILIDGKPVDTIEIEGSWMPGAKVLENYLYRTVSTRRTIDKRLLPYKEREVKLICYKYE